MTNNVREGLALFNSARFWEAHEAWERDWLTAEGDQKVFLQGLIQLAAAYHHVQKRTYRGGVRLFDAAAAKLSRVPDEHPGIDRSEVLAVAARHRERIARDEDIPEGEFPRFRYN